MKALASPLSLIRASSSFLFYALRACASRAHVASSSSPFATDVINAFIALADSDSIPPLRDVLTSLSLPPALPGIMVAANMYVPQVVLVGSKPSDDQSPLSLPHDSLLQFDCAAGYAVVVAAEITSALNEYNCQMSDQTDRHQNLAVHNAADIS